MKKLLLLVIILIAGGLGLSHYKNEMIAKEFAKQIDTISELSYGKIACSGLINADCSIDTISYQGEKLADMVILKEIDPRVQFKEGDFINLPLRAEIKNAQYSLFDISNMLKDDIQENLKDFFTRYTKNYDITIEANFLTDGKRVRDIKIIDLEAADKITPFHLQGEIVNLDTFPILKSFHANFDFTGKRIVFYDFMKAMRSCCKDKFPERYLSMSDGEIWNDMIAQTVGVLKMNVKNQFNQELETAFMKAMLAILQEEKNFLDIDVKAKKDTPLEQTVMMFFIAGPDAVKEVYDIAVKAK
jgi:hypothetical protein